MISILHSFRLCRRGIAAMEFALVLPLGVILLFGVTEVSNVLLIDRKISRAAHAGADLVSQQIAVSEANIADIFKAMQIILEPFPNRAHIRITSVVLNGVPRVDWSRSINGNRDSGTYALPPGLVAEAGSSVIVAHIVYSHSALFEGSGFGSFALEQIAYLRPRRRAKVTGP